MKELLNEIRSMIDQLVKGDDEVLSWVKSARQIDEVIRLPGDASTRRYYRVRSGTRSYIAMRTEPFPQDGSGYPFLAVRSHFENAGVDVPAVMDVDGGRGYILLEDLGDVTLLRKLQDVSTPDVERHLYERVVDSLVRLQYQGSPQRMPAEIEAYRLRFDHEKLMWEVEFTLEHFYGGYLKRNIRGQDQELLLDGFSRICRILADQPTVMTHRDFHSRNVMVLAGSGTKERFVMIDFQDARLGPPQYDLASLLRDSYYQLEESQIDRLLDYYIARWEAVSGEVLDQGEFRRIFDLMAIQRNFKAIGSFASFMNRRGDASYLKYIGNTFENIRRTLLRYPEYARLREVLFHYYYF